MSDTPEAAPAEGLLFPAFIYGDKTTCRRKMKAEAKKWAQCYLAGQDFPEPKLLPIAPGSVVFTDEHTANMVGQGYSFSPTANIVTISSNAKERGLHIQWRLYMADMLLHEIYQIAAVPFDERFTYRRAYLLFVCRYPWGALCAAARGCLLNSIEFTIPRIEGVLRFWGSLDTLRYIDFDERPISLAQFMIDHFQGVVTMWVDHPTGNIRSDLQRAVEQMRQASADEVHTRLLKSLHEYVDIKKGLQHRDWLKSPGVIEAGLEAERRRRQELYDNLTSGHSSELGTFLVCLEKNYAPTGP